MAQYLPVLLVSVTNANIVPDDTAVSTQPNGQVDYLSHQWREEDVWKSWRNMTRKKNEIANGIRLENASWRTWWKQRNKLGTVTPETLNWLKDSDVTWLYGPLHTAIDPTPSPKPPSSDDGSADKPAQDRLDLSVPSKPLAPANHTKSILKHRSISELLTADLTSPIFSPADSEEEAEHDAYGLGDIDEDEVLDVQNLSVKLQRPPLPHTRSDTHVMKAGKPFRKESPPRVPPPGTTSTEEIIPDRPDPVNRGRGLTPSNSRTNLHTYFASGAKSPTLSTSSLGGHAYAQHQHNHRRDESSRAVSVPSKSTKKRISFNTFVEQCIAIDKPRHLRGYGRYHDGEWYDDDDEEVRMRTGAGHVWHRTRAMESDSDSSYERSYFREDGSDDEGIIEMKSSTSNSLPFAERPYQQPEEPPHQTTIVSESPPEAPAASSSSTLDPPSPIPTYVQTSPTSPTGSVSRKRSKSKASTSSSSTTSTSSSSNAFSSSSRYKPRTRSGTVIRAPGSMLKTSSLGGERETLTIAPIAPTILKTGEPHQWSDDEDSYPYDVNDWAEDVTPGWLSPHGTNGNGRQSRKERSSSDTGVELVYVPPTWRNRVFINEDESDIEEEDSEEDDEDDEELYHRPSTVDVRVTPPSPRKHSRGRLSSSMPATPDGSSPLEGPPEFESRGRSRTMIDHNDEVGVGSDERHQLSFGAELRRYPSSPNGAYDRSHLVPTQRDEGIYVGDSPSSSPPKSHLFATQSSPAIAVPHSHRSISPTSNSLLSPPERGRTMSSSSLESQSSPPTQQQSQGRGRSSTRTASSLSDRERSRHGSSSFGSLSPDGVSSNASAYVNGRAGRHSRGRQRESTSRSLSSSLSPDDHHDVARSSPSKAPLVLEAHVGVVDVPSPVPEVVPEVNIEDEEEKAEEEDKCRSRNPTPSNSPRQSISITTTTQPPQVSQPASNLNQQPLRPPPSPLQLQQQQHHQRKSSLSLPDGPLISSTIGSQQFVEGPSLVGRMVSSASSYLGFWNSNNKQ